MKDKDYRVVVIGAGFGGLTAAEMLKDTGIDFTVYERSDEVGGTWRDNTYPGLFVDVPSRQYEFPFRPNHYWSRQYAPAPEIQSYILRWSPKSGTCGSSFASTRRSRAPASSTAAGISPRPRARPTSPTP